MQIYLSTNMSKNNITKNQHYISKALLELFIDGENLFETLVKNEKIYVTKAEKAMSEKYIYENKNLETNTIEKTFSKLEGQAVHKIREILHKLKGDDTDIDSLKHNIKKVMYFFLIFYYRSNALLTEFAFGKEEHKIPSMLNKIFNHPYIKILSQKIFDNYTFAILKSNKKFLLSDQYVSTASLNVKGHLIDLSNRHMMLKETLILIPLSSEYYKIFWNTEKKIFVKENQINILSDQQVEKINKVIINNSYTKALGIDKESIFKAKKVFKYKSPAQIFIGHNGNTSSGYIHKKEVFFFDKDEEIYEMLNFDFRYREFNNCRGNQKCPCGSGKSFKKCHQKIFKSVKRILNNIGKKQYLGDNTVDGSIFVEAPIESWGPMGWKV